MILGLIIPYRNRKDHLLLTLPNIIKNLTDSNINFKIAIINQDNINVFNRGYLINIGFDILFDQCDYFISHDVDLFSLTKDIYKHKLYSGSLINNIINIDNYDQIKQYKYQKLENNYTGFGGVNIFLKKDLDIINGFNNNFLGWGGEDDEIYQRFKNKNIKTERYNGNWFNIKHKQKRFYDNIFYSDNLNILKKSQNNNINFKNGYKNLKYKILSEHKLNNFKNCTIYNVNFDYQLDNNFLIIGSPNAGVNLFKNIINQHPDVNDIDTIVSIKPNFSNIYIKYNKIIIISRDTSYTNISNLKLFKNSVKDNLYQNTIDFIYKQIELIVNEGYNFDNIVFLSLEQLIQFKQLYINKVFSILNIKNNQLNINFELFDCNKKYINTNLSKKKLIGLLGTKNIEFINKNCELKDIINLNNTKQIIQFIKYCKGILNINDDVNNFIFKTQNFCWTKINDFFKNRTHLFIELSSRIVYKYKSYYTFDHIDDCIIQTEEEIENDILEIITLCKEKNIYFITSFNFNILERKDFISIIKNIFVKYNLNYFIPDEFNLGKYIVDSNFLSNKGQEELVICINKYFNFL